MRDTLEELSIFYPDSPLNFDFGGSKGPKAGERVLDGEVVLAVDLSTTTLSALTNHQRWTILLFSGKAPDEAITGELATIRSAASMTAMELRARRSM
ncbi:MAG TPA: hypothetical protein VKY22_12240 [Bradyrhizobium sp.]|nr:hypothetical protein [Bradyrhizobium sp.]